jgi:hypothetical protein
MSSIVSGRLPSATAAAGVSSMSATSKYFMEFPLRASA